MKVCRNELKELLQISLEALKKIEKRQTLEQRLTAKGYKLIAKYTEGRRFVYEIENEKHQELIRTTKKESLNKYLELRSNSYPYSIEDIARVIRVNKNTVSKWDRVLLDKGILKRDGYYYYMLNKVTGEMTSITIEQYKGYWRNRIQASKCIMREKEVPMDIKVVIANKYCYKVKKYLFMGTQLINKGDG